MKRIVILGLLCLILLVSCDNSDGDARLPTPTPHLVKECIYRIGYCKAMQITDLETGCVTVIGFENAFSGASSIHVDCP